jgi:sigma-E factor negative regulatory protein RseA
MSDMLDTRESVSALADGQLRGAAFASAVEAVAVDAQARQAWHTYHLIGDVLRSGELAACGDSAFVDRLRARLRQEPGLDRPRLAPAAVAPHRAAAAPANESSFRWKLAAGFASLAAVAAIGWNAAGGWADRALPAQLAQQSPAAAAPAQPVLATVAVAGGEPQVMIRDARLDELLAAHKQFGGASALQMPAGFLRNATFEGSAR